MQTGPWLSLEVTGSDGPRSGDVSNGPAPIREGAAAAGGTLQAVLVGRAYDAKTCHGAARDVGAELVTPPKDTAVYGLGPDRDQHLAQIGRWAEETWKRRVG